jgi:hypothetical protein
MDGAISLTITSAQIAEVRQELAAVRDGAEKAIRAAINDALRWGRTRWARQMREVENLSYSIVLGTISISQMASDGSMQGILTLTYEREPLADFKAKFSAAAGVSVTTIKSQGVHQFKHMFRATVGAGHAGIFEDQINKPKHVAPIGRYAGRVIKRGPRKGQPLLRRPIREAYGPSVLTAFEKTPEVPQEVVDQIGAKFQERLDSKIAWQLAKGVANAPEDV